MQQDTRQTTGGSTFVGQAMERLEDDRLLRGLGSYADDLGTKPGTLQAAVLRSPHAHARITRLEVTRAEALTGVVAVLTPEDVQRWSAPFVAGVKQPMPMWSLAQGCVRYVGEPIAVVVAVDRYIAEDALDLIDVEYEALPVVADLERALSPDSAVLHQGVGSNVVSERNFCYGTAPGVSTRRVSTTVRYPRNSCSPIECGVVLAEYRGETEGYDALSNFMGPFSLHAVMSMALKVPGNKLRHRVPRDSGGSFGVKQAVFPYVVLMCLAARKAGRPVKWVEDRLEHLSAATSATARLTTLAADVDDAGRIHALHWDQVDEVGGYLRAPEPATFYRMHGCLSGPYDVPHLTVRNRVVVCNKTPTGLVRGFGGPQVYYALERLMDTIAVQLGIDPCELRQKNFVQASQFPYAAAAGALLDSGDYAGLSAQVMARAAQEGLFQRQQEARAQGRLYGIGMAAIVEPSVSNMGYISTVLTPEQRAKAGPKNGAIASATLAIDLLGGVNVTIASAPAGQGHMTVCAQVVADVLGVSPDQVVVNVEFDTAKDAWSVAAGNYSSRFAGAVAGVVHLAALQMRDKLARIAAPQLQCTPQEVRFEGGHIINGIDPEQRVPFTRLAANPHWAPGTLPEGVSPGLRETAFWTPKVLHAPDEQDRVNTSAAYGFVFDVCGVEVDTHTGAIRIDRYITGHDAGRLLNPALADGQIRGAFAQGLGAALMEEFSYGADGSFQSGTLVDYRMPTACEVVDPIIVHMETPSPFTPLGAKGLGEGNNMSTPVCVANAFMDALRPVCPPEVLDAVRLPLAPGRVLGHLQALQEAPPASWVTRQKALETEQAERQMVSNVDHAGAAGSINAAPVTGRASTGEGLSLQASGDVRIAAAPAQVFATLTDPAALARVIPGCHALDEIAPQHYRAEVTVGIGLIKARYVVQLTLSDLNPPYSLRLSGIAQASLGTGQGDGQVQLQGDGVGGTRLQYDYRAQVGGKVAMVGSRMLEGAARMIIAELFESLARQVSGVPAQPTLWQRIQRWVQRVLQRVTGGGA